MVLLELGFVNEKQNEDIEMAAELITQIQADKESEAPSIKLENLLTILTAVLNFELTHMLTKESSKDPEQIGTFNEDGDYKVSPKEVQQLHKRF